MSPLQEMSLLSAYLTALKQLCQKAADPAVGVCSGIFVGGRTPIWLVASRGTLVAHVMDCEGAVAGFTPFHNIGCPYVRPVTSQLCYMHFLHNGYTKHIESALPGKTWHSAHGKVL